MLPHLPRVLPDVGEADGGMEAVVDPKRDRDVAEDGPGLGPIELHLQRVVLGLLRLESVDDPHGEVAEQQEGDVLPPWLLPLLQRRAGRHAISGQQEDGLEGRLQHHGEVGDDGQRRAVRRSHEDGGDEAEDVEGQETGVGDDDEGLLQVRLVVAVGQRQESGYRLRWVGGLVGGWVRWWVRWWVGGVFAWTDRWITGRLVGLVKLSD